MWVHGGMDNPAQRRVYGASLSSGHWTAPRTIDGGLPNPAPYSLDLTDDIAAAGGTVVFTAGPLTVGEGFEINNQRVYGVTLGAGASTPVPIDNGPGGEVHVVAADAEPSGTAAALFTQLGPDGNLRLYGVENLCGPVFLRPSTFGKTLCTDVRGGVAGCVTAQLDPLRATLAPPSIEPNTSALLSGSLIIKRPPSPSVAVAAAKRIGRNVQIALQRTSGRTCSWWSTSRRRFIRGGCHRPQFFTLRVTGSRWKLKTAKLGAGPVTVWARATSGSRVQQVFVTGANKRAVKIKAASKRRAKAG